jgi:hypothetical protein
VVESEGANSHGPESCHSDPVITRTQVFQFEKHCHFILISCTILAIHIMKPKPNTLTG